jgi:hypothetical protein
MRPDPQPDAGDAGAGGLGALARHTGRSEGRACSRNVSGGAYGMLAGGEVSGECAERRPAVDRADRGMKTIQPFACAPPGQS